MQHRPRALVEGLTLVTAPTVEPVTVAEAKVHCAVSRDDHDDLIERLITAARQACEAATRRALCTQTWDLTLPGWPDDDRRARIYLPLPPLVSVTSITYLDAAGDEQTIDDATYKVRAGSPGIVSLRNGELWPSVLDEDDPITIRFVAGYGVAANVPATLKQAMLLLVGHWYEHPEAVVTGTIATELPLAVKSLLATEAWGSYA